MLFPKSSLAGLLLLVGLLACQPPPVRMGFFTASVYLRPYETQLDQPLTIILDESIPDQFWVGRMDVLQFRNTLKLSLYYTFENSVPDIIFSDTIADTGMTLHLYRVRPEWNIVNTYTSMSVIEGTGFSSTQTEVGSLIRYDGVVYKNGEKWFVLNDFVNSEQTTLRRKRQPEVFQDGVRELCEDLYRKIVHPDTKAAIQR